MKKLIIVLIGLIVLLSLPQNVVYADDGNNLQTSVVEQLDNINFDKVNSLLKDLEKEYSYLGNDTFKDKVSSILSGKYFDNYNNLLSSVSNLFLGQIKAFLPTIMIILCIAILGSIIHSFQPSKAGDVSAISHFACYGLIIILVTIVIKHICSITSDTIASMQNQMTAIFPILLTLLTAIGSVSSVSIYTPVVSILTGAVNTFFYKLLYPLFITSFIFVIIGHLTDGIKMDKFNKFLSSSFKWLVGIVFTLFSGILAVQGITAGKADGVSIKLTKFTVKSYIPIIGSYISDGFDMIVLSSVLIKNAVGLVGLIMLVLSILTPVITIVVIKLSLKLCAGIIEPVGNAKISGFLDKCSDILIYPIVIILAMAFMYVITLSLIVATSNVI